MDNGKSKFGYSAMAFWGGSALILDVASLIPIVGDFAGPIFWGSFAFYLWKSGYGFLNPKRLAVGGLDMVIKMIPVIQEIPVELALGAAAVIAMIKIEEKTGLKLPGMKGVPGKGEAPGKATPGHTPPANFRGRRQPGTNPANPTSAPNANTNVNRRIAPAPNKLHPKQEERMKRIAENPNTDFAAQVYGKTLNEKYKEYIERGFDEKSAAGGAESDAKFAAEKERRGIWSEANQDYI